MLAKSHAALGALGAIAAFPLAQYCGISREFYLTLLAPLVILGSLFPDIDEPKSFIGRKLPLLSRIVSLNFSHRGFTHFAAFPLIFLALGICLPRDLAACAFSFALGIFLHQIGDMLTVSGIPHYFFPISRARAVLLPQFLRFRTGSVREKAIFTLILVPLNAVLIAHFGFDVNLADLKIVEKLLKEFL